MPKEKHRQTGITLFHKIVQSMLILHHDGVAAVAPVCPVVILNGGLAVSNMIVTGYNETGVGHGKDHMQIPSRMFTETVHKLHDAADLSDGLVDPAVDRVLTGKRREADFMKHKALQSEKHSNMFFKEIMTMGLRFS